MKFVHAANIKLNITGEKRAEYRRDLQKVIEACNASQADALFITGNLFASEPSAADLSEADSLFSQLNSCRVFILTGDLDAPAPGEMHTGYEWKSKVTVFYGDCIQRVYMAKQDTEITGVGYSADTWDKVDPEKLSRGKKGSVQILLLPFLGESQDDFPEEADRIELPFDYTGAGSHELYIGNERNKTFSPGDFEPEGFSGQIRHGFFICEVRTHNGQPSLIRQFVPSASREYISLKVNCTADLSYNEAVRQIRGIMEKYGKENYYEIILQGRLSPSLLLQEESLKSLSGILSVRDETAHEADVSFLLRARAGDEAADRFAKEAEKIENDSVRQKAMWYGINALLNGDSENA